MNQPENMNRRMVNVCKKILVIVGVLIVSVPVVCSAAGEDNKNSKDKVELKSETEKINYSIGYQIGGDFDKQGWKLDPELVVRGIRDAMSHSEPLMTPDQMQATLVALKKELVANETLKAQATDRAFLAENAKKEGVVSLPDGVQYKVIKAGTGKQPTSDSTVTVRYKVSGANGQPVSGSAPEGAEGTYPVKKALPGLQEALLLMKEGAIWQVVIPPGPALGNQGEALEKAGVLIYQLELVSVQ